MKSMSGKKLAKLLEANGWDLLRIQGSNTPDTFRVVTTESGFQPYSTVKRLTRNQGLQTFSEKLSGLLSMRDRD
jgi:predicted RNA binding protein YcfA (HicA-like mRNA interferase family)